MPFERIDSPFSQWVRLPQFVSWFSTKNMRRVAKMADREGISDVDAMRLARREYPEVFDRLQTG